MNETDKEKLREEFMESFAMPIGDIPKGGAEDIANWFISQIDPLIESSRREVLEDIKVRTWPFLGVYGKELKAEVEDFIKWLHEKYPGTFNPVALPQDGKEIK